MGDLTVGDLVVWDSLREEDQAVPYLVIGVFSRTWWSENRQERSVDCDVKLLRHDGGITLRLTCTRFKRC